MRLSTCWVLLVSLLAFACGGGQPASTPNVAPVVTPLPDNSELELDDEADDDDADETPAPAGDAGAGDEDEGDDDDDDDA